MFRSVHYVDVDDKVLVYVYYMLHTPRLINIITSSYYRQVITTSLVLCVSKARCIYYYIGVRSGGGGARGATRPPKF